jgi:membrane protein implicated in regulation of membrane protease activity
MDMEAEVDADADADGDHDVAHGVSGFDALEAWLPIASMRFWTFFLAFFGLTGTVMTAGSLLGGIATPIIAGAVGYVCGASITNSIRRLRKNRVDSTLREADYVGATGKVTLPISKDQTGKVRMAIKGRVIELMAETEDDVQLGVDQVVMVYAIKDDGIAVVSRTDQLPE